MKKRMFFNIMIVITIITILFPAGNVYAANAEQAGKYVASYAQKFCETNTLKFDASASPPGSLNGNVYTSETIGFCKYMYSHAIGYNGGIPVPASNNGGSDSDPNTQLGKTSDDFEVIAVNDIGKAKPGDIIENCMFVMIYVGSVNGQSNVIANNNVNNSSSGLANGLVPFAEYSSQKNYNFRVWRLKDSVAEGLDSSSFESGGTLSDGVSNSSSTGGFGKKLDTSDWYYNGIPDGKYSVVASVWEIIIDNIGQIFDYLVGFGTLIIRMVFVGWTTLIEKLVNFTVQSITGGEPLDKISATSTDVDTGDYVSIEKIIFNEISVFDVNFFNFNE